MNEVFPCSSCGACCKSIQLSPLTAWLDRGDGVCKHFDDTENVCSIYESRPEICNVRVMYDKHYKNCCDWTEFVFINQQVCEELLKLSKTVIRLTINNGDSHPLPATQSA